MAATKNAFNSTGMFSELSYISVGDKYKDNTGTKPFNEKAYKGKQMMTTIPKSKSALQAGYFSSEKEFPRMFKGEGYHDPVAAHRKEQHKNKGKMRAGAFKPPQAAGQLFTPKVERFNPADRPAGAKPKEPRNFTTRPGKQGSGSGYADVGFNKFPEYKSSKYDAAGEKARKDAAASKAKLRGGAFKPNGHSQDVFEKNPFVPKKAQKTRAPKQEVVKKIAVPWRPTKPPGTGLQGTLDKFPEYKADTGRPQKKAEKAKFGEWKPTAGAKPRVVKSIMTMGVQRQMTSQNFQTVNLSSTFV